MNGEKEILLNIYSKVEELEQEILEYKKSLHENLIVNKEGFEEKMIDDNYSGLLKVKKDIDEAINM